MLRGRRKERNEVFAVSAETAETKYSEFRLTKQSTVKNGFELLQAEMINLVYNQV